MVDKDNLCRMIALARFEKKNEDKALRINNSYQQDYIASAMIRNFLLITIAYALLLVVIGMMNLDVWLSNLNNLNFQPLLLVLVIGYLLLLGIYSVIAYVLAKLRYMRAQNGIRQYKHGLEQLKRIYRAEDSLHRSESDEDEDEEA
ncbi:MAG: hypothetical protein IKE31_11230 [Eubacterium sp.]|nr:hypothetical protein [Eubacterium sp.]